MIVALAILTDLHTKLETAFGSTLVSKAGQVMNVISPVIMSAFILYVLLVVMTYMKNGTDPSEIGFDIIQRMLSWAVVIGLSMNIGNFNSILVPIVKGVPIDIMNIFVSNGGDPYAQLDTLIDTYIQTMQTGWDNAHGIEASLMAVVICVVLLISAIISVVISSAFLLMAEIFVSILLVVAPIFISLALFPATRQFASLWVNQIVYCGLLLIFTSVLTSIQILALQEFVVAGTAEMTWSFALQVAIVSGVFAVFTLQVKHYASQLSGGMALGGFRETGRAIAGGAKMAGGFAKGAGGIAGGAGRAGAGAFNALKNRFSGNNIKPEKAGK